MAGETSVTVDVREDIRAGREPFARIMAAVRALDEGQSLTLINVFEPVPLYGVMAEKGYQHETRRTADGDWEIRFYRP